MASDEPGAVQIASIVAAQGLALSPEDKARQAQQAHKMIRLKAELEILLNPDESDTIALIEAINQKIDYEGNPDELDGKIVEVGRRLANGRA